MGAKIEFGGFFFFFASHTSKTFQVKCSLQLMHEKDLLSFTLANYKSHYITMVPRLQLQSLELGKQVRSANDLCSLVPKEKDAYCAGFTQPSGDDGSW